MTAKHSEPEFRKNSRIIRQQVNKVRRHGGEVTCWRCGLPIDEQQTFDVGHIDANSGHSAENLAPEHRYRSGRCQGNRAAGGRLGRSIQTARQTASKGLLPW
jgi:hypothetical protein